MHIPFNAQYPTTLTQIAQISSIDRAFSNPNVNTYLLGVYDSTSGDHATNNIPDDPFQGKTKLFLNPTFFTMNSGAYNAAVEQEYRQLTLHLYQRFQGTGKRFILTSQETEHDVYGYVGNYINNGPIICHGMTVSYRDFMANCVYGPQGAYNFSSIGVGGGYPSGPNDGLQGVKLWMEARQRGIAQGRIDAANARYTGVEVYHGGPEPVSIRLLHDNGFQDLFHDIIPNLTADSTNPFAVGYEFVSYSAYDTTNLTSQTEDSNLAKTRITNDLTTISGLVHTRNIIIGEFCYSSTPGTECYLVSNEAEAVRRTNDVLDATLDWGGLSLEQFKGVPYVFNWQLFDDANNGVYDRNQTLQPLGIRYKQRYEENPLMFYPLAQPVRLLDTRVGFTACFQPNAPITGGTSLNQPARVNCNSLVIPSNAIAITGNVTTVQSGGGFLTLYPSGAAQPTVANSNYGPNEIINNVFTVGLGDVDGAFNIFASSTTDVVVDVTGYYAPPGTGGLYFHPLPSPKRLLETRPGQAGCVTPGTPLQLDFIHFQGRVCSAL